MALIPTTPTVEQLKRALAIQEKIAELQAQLEAVLGGTAPKRGRKPSVSVSPADAGEGKGNGKRRKKRVMSAEAREKIAAAQRKRWAKQKKNA